MDGTACCILNSQIITMPFISIILVCAAIYLVMGLLFAIPFVLKGVDAVDEGAHGAGWGFRLIIIPGTIVFWPLLLRKWMHAPRKLHEQIDHDDKTIAQ